MQAIATQNKIGIVQSEETIPRVFIGNCLVDLEDYICTISVMNTNKESVEIVTPYVSVKELQASIRADVLTLQAAEKKELLLKKSQTAHLNIKERKTLEHICEEYCEIFHLENDALTYASTVSHEIAGRTNSAPVNIRPYRLPEKHKAEVNRQIKKVLDGGIIHPSTMERIDTSRSQEA